MYKAHSPMNALTDLFTDPMIERENLRILEAVLFASPHPTSEEELKSRLPNEAQVKALLLILQGEYEKRGVNLIQVAGKWAFRTAIDLGFLLSHEAREEKKLSRPAIETLAIIAYHQPVTRAEIEDIRGVQVAKGTIDILLEAGWIRLRGRRKVIGRPVTYGTTANFLDHFGLEAINDLPGLDELKNAGLLEGRLPASFAIPSPIDDIQLRDDEEELETELDLTLAPEVGS
jgi:segregation and condensation protein B